MAQLVAIVNGSEDAILSKGLDGRIKSWNPAACRLYGYTAQEMIGQKITLLIPPELQDQEEQVLQVLRRGKHVEHFVTIRLAKSGERIPVALTVAPLRDEQGAIIAVSSITRDMRGHEHEQALLAADRRKNEFMALLGHELRNPVAPIYNASELLSRMLREQPQARDLSELIRRQARQLTRLIDDLLDVARIKQGRIALECRPLRLSQVIAQGIESVAPLMQVKHHHLIVAPPPYEIYVNADATRLMQCLANLLTNAAKFTDAGGRIQVESRMEGLCALIEVSDNGCGISAPLLARVFDLYVQDDRTRDRSQGGLGIGLPVVKQLIELQGGSVCCRSDGPGRGATFQLRLPATPELKATGPETASLPGNSMRIFIVDDNVDGARSLALLLQAEGHFVQETHTARDALREIDSFKPDVALIDIGLPQMNGYELLEYLRPRAALRGTRFVALTGYPQDEGGGGDHRGKFDAYLIKPVDAEILTRTLRDLRMGPTQEAS